MRDVLLVALRLGLTSFGGPIAHLGYFGREYVDRRRWIDPATFAELLALCQALPGPASSQLGIAIGTTVAGRWGGVAAWLGFTAPSAALMVAFAMVSRSTSIAGAGWVHGLELAAVAVVSVAVVSLARAHATEVRRGAIAVAAGIVAFAVPGPFIGPLVIVVGALVGVAILTVPFDPRPATSSTARSRGLPASSAIALGAFVVLLAALPLARALDGHVAAIVDTFYRSGSLVFGGGHVVLPLLHDGTVDAGWVANDDFLAGYGAAQALPGPLFTFAAYLGAVALPAPNGAVGGVIALGSIFLPSFLLVFGLLPVWSMLREGRRLRAALAGAAAAVVGLLAAALVQPVATTGLRSWLDAVLALTAALLLASGRVPVLAIVAVLAILGQTGA